jgi:ribosome-binding protein aMBF1 (putative translation factor)
MPKAKLKPPYLFDAAAFRRRITAALASRGLSLRAAADEVRCDYSILTRIRNGRMKPNTEVYLRIEAWLAKHAPSRERTTKVRTDK